MKSSKNDEMLTFGAALPNAAPNVLHKSGEMGGIIDFSSSRHGIGGRIHNVSR